MDNSTHNDPLEQLAIQAVRTYGLHEQVKNVHAEMMKEMQPARRTISMRTKIIRFSVAAAAAIFIAVIAINIYLSSQLTPTILFNEKYQSFELPVTRDINTTTISAIEQEYRQKHFAKVIELRNAKDSAGLQDDFFAGLASLELNNPGNAVKYLDHVIRQNNSSARPVFKDETEFYIALAYLELKNYRVALLYMQTIHDDPNHLYHEKFTDNYIKRVRKLE